MSYQRSFVEILSKRLRQKRLFIQVLAGPRRVGKTTAIDQVIAQLDIHTVSYTTDGINSDDPAWIDQIWASLRTEMRLSHIPEAILVIDEIQKISDWSSAVKRNWDADTKNQLNIKLVILGSSRLLLQKGLSESLMGRYELIYASHWSYAEILAIDPAITPEQFAWFGGYPEPLALISDEKRFRSYIRNSIIEPTIKLDILELDQVNKPALLSQLLNFGISYSSQVISYSKILGQLQDSGNAATVAHYLRLLDQAGLLSGLENYSAKPVKTRSSSPKLQLQNTALLASQPAMDFRSAQLDTAYWGRVIESTVGAFLLNTVKQDSDYQLYYWRERDLEIDFVIKHGPKLLGIEVKSSASEANPKASRLFKEKFSGAEVILVGDQGIRWQDFIQLRDISALF